MLGNNSHQFNDKNLVLGNDKEPSFPHLHFFGRGNLEHEYISGCKLRGPIPGNDVNLRDKYHPSEEEVYVLKSYFNKKSNLKE